LNNQGPERKAQGPRINSAGRRKQADNGFSGLKGALQMTKIENLFKFKFDPEPCENFDQCMEHDGQTVVVVGPADGSGSVEDADMVKVQAADGWTADVMRHELVA
jgi:hypothetical protein